jgi:hypothetical protein
MTPTRAMAWAHEAGAQMNDVQRLLVIFALTMIGIILPWHLLEWGRAGPLENSILVFHEISNGPGLVPDRYGIYIARGVSHLFGILFGVVLPLCLFAAAGFFGFSGRVFK